MLKYEQVNRFRQELIKRIQQQLKNTLRLMNRLKQELHVINRLI